jgi:hypothetical protein
MKKLTAVIFCIGLCAVGCAIISAFPLSYVASSIGHGCMGLGMGGSYYGAVFGRKGFVIGSLLLTAMGAFHGAFHLGIPLPGGLIGAYEGAVAGLLVGVICSGAIILACKFTNR